MGRDLPSATALVRTLIANLKSLGEMLPPNMRRIIGKFSETTLNQRTAIAEATDLLPLEAALVIVLAEEHVQNRRENNALYEQIQELRDEIERLKKKK